MKLYECIIPQIDVNDKRIVVNDFRFNEGDRVSKLDTILSLETAKAVSDFYTEESGFIAYCVEEGDELSIGSVVANIYDNPEEARIYAKEIAAQRASEHKLYKATSKAVKLASELGVNLDDIGKVGIIKEADVRAYHDSGR